MLVEIAYLPNSTTSLKGWLLNFNEHIPEIGLLLGIPEEEIQCLCRKLDLVINDLKKKEFGMDHDHISTNRKKYKTLAELDAFVVQLKKNPGFHPEVHGSILRLDRRYNKAGQAFAG